MSNRVRELREARQWSQPELARIANTTHATIHRLETGRRGMTEKWVRTFAGIFKVHPGEIFEKLPAPVRHSEADKIAEKMSAAQLASWLEMGRLLIKKR